VNSGEPPAEQAEIASGWLQVLQAVEGEQEVVQEDGPSSPDLRGLDALK